MNPAVTTLFAAKEAEICEDIPAFNAATLIGTNMDVFHKNPEHQRGLIENLNTAHTAQATVGGVSFRITVNPMHDSQGNRLGTAIEWADITHRS